MVELGDYYFFDEEALLERLTNGAIQANKEVVFVVGAPLSGPFGEERRGVYGVAEIVELIRTYFQNDSKQLSDFDRQVRDSDNRYQAAFRFLQGRRGQDAANQIVRQAVLGAHRGAETEADALIALSDNHLRDLDRNTDSWILSPGVQALGELVSGNPDRFGRLIITSNFDPLVEISIKRAGGFSWRTTIHSDGDFSQSKADGCQVLHLHGYWHGSDTLHTGNQLLQRRPFLRNSLLKYLEDKTVVVVAYGGWEDVFTASLESIIGDAGKFPEVLWTFNDSAPVIHSHLRSILAPGIARNRVTLYSGIDCHAFLPKLARAWERETQKPAIIEPPTPSSSNSSKRPRFSLRRLECDRPPSFEAWVGREDELRALETTKAKVAIICGMGGQGKSVLAAKFLTSVADGETIFCDWDWRDCKEEKDRIRTQIIASVERLLADEASIVSLESASDSDLVEIFVSLAADKRIVFIFDNVDQYIDLEKGEFIGILDTLVRKFCNEQPKSRLIFTCRPQVQYEIPSVITLSLKGLSLDETIELFQQRVGTKSTPEPDIATAHEMTRGHAFWLDLMAAQIARVPGKTLGKLIEDLRRGREGPPDVLSSIWDTLAERERTVLRVMAEARRPETEELIEKFIASEINYKNFKRALRSLISLNMVVVKAETNSPDLYDLHPLVRQFVRTKFDQRDRRGVIETIISQYIVIIRGVESMLGVYLPFPLLERWSQKAELEVDAGRYGDAFTTLDKAEDALIGGGHYEEYIRVARKLFETVDWIPASSFEKFDNVFENVVSCLNELEQYKDADDMLKRFEETVTSKNARYIKYCDIRAFSFWQRGNYHEATQWAERGQNLKEGSGVDTQNDCAHTLALARRDGGDPAKALEYFTKSYSLDELVNPDTVVSVDDAPTLGNVGRCLQMLQRVEDALICYRKSARRLEDDNSRHRIGNQTYARRWIAEALFLKGDRELAYSFYLDAEDLARKFAPGRYRQILKDRNEKFPNGFEPSLSRTAAKRRVEEWIAGSLPLFTVHHKN